MRAARSGRSGASGPDGPRSSCRTLRLAGDSPPARRSASSSQSSRHGAGKRAWPTKLAGMPGIDLDRLEKAAELLGLAFYGLLLIAAAAALSGAPGWGFLFLLAAGGAHAGRASFEEFVEVQRARDQRVRPEPRREAASRV